VLTLQSALRGGSKWTTGARSQAIDGVAIARPDTAPVGPLRPKRGRFAPVLELLRVPPGAEMRSYETIPAKCCPSCSRTGRRSMLHKTWAVLVMVLAVASAHAAVQWKEGTPYTMLKVVQPVANAGKVEVIEFFWYGCPHCNAIEPFVDAWAAKLPRDVTFRRAHVVWPGRSDIEAHARIFLALKSMGLDAKYQQAVFDATFKDNLDMRRKEVVVEWAGKHGLDRAKFASLYDSFAVSSQLEQLRRLTKTYSVQDVPNIVVNGKWVTSPGHIGKEDGTVLQVVDELIARERGRAVPEKKK